MAEQNSTSSSSVPAPPAITPRSAPRNSASKAACVDAWIGKDSKAALGGTCLNVGCIPSKALLDSSKQFWNLTHHFGVHGITADGRHDRRQDDASAARTRSSNSSPAASAMLFKGNKITPFAGRPGCSTDRQVEMTAADGSKQTISRHQRHHRDWFRADRTPVREVRWQDHRRQRRRAGLRCGAQAPRRDRRRRHRPRTRQRVEAPRQRRDDHRSVTRLPGHGRCAKSPRPHQELTKQGLKIELGAKLSEGRGQGQRSAAHLRRARTARRSSSSTSCSSPSAVAPTPTACSADGTGVKLDERGRIVVDEHCWTGVDGVWAVGDCVRGPMLAHKGSEEGIAVAELIAGKAGHVNYDTIPWVIYTEPEIAWVGKTEEQLQGRRHPVQDRNVPVRRHRPRRGDERNRRLGEGDCPCGNRPHPRRAHRRPGSFRTFAESVVAMYFNGAAEDLARIVHAHPTLSEAVHEAAMSVDKRAIHKAN